MLPINVFQESLPDKFNDFFVRKIKEIRSSFDHGRPILTNPAEFSGTIFAEFQLVTEDRKNCSPGNARNVLRFRALTHSCPIGLFG